MKGTAFEKGSTDALCAGRRIAPAFIVRTFGDANILGPILGLITRSANVGGPGAKAAADPSMRTRKAARPMPGCELLEDAMPECGSSALRAGNLLHLEWNRWY